MIKAEIVVRYYYPSTVDRELHAKQMCIEFTIPEDLIYSIGKDDTEWLKEQGEKLAILLLERLAKNTYDL